jgi:hypothetical protein
MGWLVRDIAVWLCVLAVLAVVALATSGALEIVLTLVVVFAWVFSLGRPRPAVSERPSVPLLVVVVPAVVALVIADALSSDEWFGFAAVAVAFPVMVIWRDVHRRWQDRRAPHGAA